MSDKISFDGKVAIVTGAGGGLGRSHALELARRGAKVVVNDLGAAADGSGGPSEAAVKVVEEIKALGGDAIANGSSVTDDAGVALLVKDTIDAFGRIDILVNNAGYTWDGVVHKITAVNILWSPICHHYGTPLSPHVTAMSPLVNNAGYTWDGVVHEITAVNVLWSPLCHHYGTTLSPHVTAMSSTRSRRQRLWSPLCVTTLSPSGHQLSPFFHHMSPLRRPQDHSGERPVSCTRRQFVVLTRLPSPRRHYRHRHSVPLTPPPSLRASDTATTVLAEAVVVVVLGGRE